MFRTFATKIKKTAVIRYKPNKKIKKILIVHEDYTYSKYTVDNINKQKKRDDIHRYWRYHHGDEL